MNIDNQDNKDSKDKERLKWACRRGMLELDLFLVPFFENNYEIFTLDEKNNFTQLLKEDDPSLLTWLMAEKAVDNPQFAELIEKIRQYRLSRATGSIL